MKKIAVIALLLNTAFTVSVSAKAEAAPVSVKCNNDNEGPRKAARCNVSQVQLGMSWKGQAGRARKLYIRKPKGDSGQEIVRWWLNGKRRKDVLINPGDATHIFLKKGESTVSTKVEIETVKLPSQGPSKFYVQLETLDRPKMPDLSSCSNTATADRQSVCWTGSF